MRLFCRDDHDDRLCPSGPIHDFTGSGWTTDDHGVGVTWCTRCGDIRQLMPASITACELETISLEVE
jgi:hypothetical protein